MSLPGKLTIGFLHEDNPLKSFFRMKPILTEGVDGLVPSDIEERFPEEGFIRIVPDKNEIAIFRIRMRQMNRYCALDLRKHLSENDKIRPNKNYIPGGSEHNEYIVYSDVIGRVPPHLIAEVIDTILTPVDDKLTLAVEHPGTMYVIIRTEDKLSGPWTWEDDGFGGVALSHALNQPFSELKASIMEGKTMPVPLEDDTEALLLYDLSAFKLGEVELPPSGFERLSESIDVPRYGLMREAAERARHIGSAETFHGMEATIAPTLQSKSQEVPWLVRGDYLKPRVVNTRLSFREQSLQAQSGINPRRGRSLHEVVDEQWRKSRYDQLGHPVPAQANARPITNPIERATSAVNEAWGLSEARPTLVSELLKIEDLRETLKRQMNMPENWLEGRSDDGKLNELEASRLKLMNEIDGLRLKRNEVKAQLMDELSAGYDKDLSEMEHKKKALQAEISRNERAAQDAQALAEQARKLLDESDENLKERLLSGSLNRQIGALMRDKGVRGMYPSAHPVTYEPTVGGLISDVRVRLGRAGFELSNDEAVNLLCCVMAGGMLILSGPTGCGKSDLARSLAGALGVGSGSGRFVEARTPKYEKIEQMMSVCDDLTMHFVLLDDYNMGNKMDSLDELFRLQDQIRLENKPICLVLTVQDAPDGRPLPARLLARSFFIRLKETEVSAPWNRGRIQKPEAEKAVALGALRKVFSREKELPVEIVDLMDKLRGEFSKLRWTLDRRTLDEMWDFCVMARSGMQCTGTELLDYALAGRAFPAMMAMLDIDGLREVVKVLASMPRCIGLMDQPLPLPPL